jgi:PAS domain S-box-containing protein
MNSFNATGHHQFPLRPARALPWLVLALGLLVTLHLHLDARNAAEERLSEEFAMRAPDVVAAIDKRLHDYEQVLRGAAGLFAASAEVTRAEFRAYVDRLELADHYPGIQGVGFSVVLPPGTHDRHVEQVRAEGVAGYTVHPPGERPVVTSIVYLEPQSGRNLRAFGYDMYAEPVRRAAMERARDSGTTALSGKVRLMQETDRDVQAGFLMYIPVYANGARPLTVAARQAALLGWAYAPFRMHDLMDGIVSGAFRNASAQLALEIFDGDSLAREALMYDSTDVQGVRGAAGSDAWREARFSSTHTVTRGAHRWTLRIRSLPPFTDRGGAQWLIAAVGAGLTLLMAFIVHLLESGHARAVRYAGKMNRDLSESEARFRLVADSAPVMIWMSDAAHGCIWVNERSDEFTGRALTPDPRQLWREVIHPDDFREAADAYHAAADRHAPFRAEFRVRRADGAYRWVINTGVPRFDPAGAFVGYIGSCLDITERKLAEKQLKDMALRLEHYAAEVDDLYQHAPCGYHSLDVHGTIVAVNDTELSWLGYRREEVVGKPFTLFLSPDEHAAFAQQFPRAQEQDGCRDIPCTLVRKDGSRLAASLSATLVRDKDGRFVRTRSVVHDMTEHRRLERERAEHALHGERLSRRLVAVQEEERRRLATTLHDSTSPNLATLRLILGTIANAASTPDPAQVRATLEDAQALLDDTTAGLREICSDLRSTVLDLAGLQPAIESYAGQFRLRTGIDVRLHGSAPAALSSEIDSALFRIVQEALANCAKHAHASAIDITLERHAADVRLTIADNGAGFDGATLSRSGFGGGLGLITMRERTEFIGGRFSVESSPGAGVTICVDIPVEPAMPALRTRHPAPG